MRLSGGKLNSGFLSRFLLLVLTVTALTLSAFPAQAKCWCIPADITCECVGKKFEDALDKMLPKWLVKDDGSLFKKLMGPGTYNGHSISESSSLADLFLKFTKPIVEEQRASEANTANQNIRTEDAKQAVNTVRAQQQEDVTTARTFVNSPNLLCYYASMVQSLAAGNYAAGAASVQMASVSSQNSVNRAGKIRANGPIASDSEFLKSLASQGMAFPEDNNGANAQWAAGGSGGGMKLLHRNFNKLMTTLVIDPAGTSIDDKLEGPMPGNAVRAMERQVFDDRTFVTINKDALPKNLSAEAANVIAAQDAYYTKVQMAKMPFFDTEGRKTAIENTSFRAVPYIQEIYRDANYPNYSSLFSKSMSYAVQEYALNYLLYANPNWLKKLVETEGNLLRSIAVLLGRINIMMYSQVEQQRITNMMLAGLYSETLRPQFNDLDTEARRLTGQPQKFN